MRKLGVIIATCALAACGPTTTEQTEAPAVAATTSTAWDRDLPALLPQIDACIRDGRGARTVSYAGPHDDGMTLVRLQGESPIDCRVGSVTSSPTVTVDIRPRDENLVIDGENAAIFVRGPGENPGGECYEAPEVRDANGVVIGWMLDPDSC